MLVRTSSYVRHTRYVYDVITLNRISYFLLYCFFIRLPDYFLRQMTWMRKRVNNVTMRIDKQILDFNKKLPGKAKDAAVNKIHSFLTDEKERTWLRNHLVDAERLQAHRGANINSDDRVDAELAKEWDQVRRDEESVWVCMCERERERKRERPKQIARCKGTLG